MFGLGKPSMAWLLHGLPTAVVAVQVVMMWVLYTVGGDEKISHSPVICVRFDIKKYIDGCPYFAITKAWTDPNLVDT